MRVLVAGGGKVGGALAARLLADGHQLTVIDRDRAVCERLFEASGITAVAGEATDPSVLAEAGLGRVDVAAAMLARDADNLAFALLVRARSNARVMVRLLDPAYEEAYRLAGVRDVVGEVELVVSRIAAAVEFPSLGRTLPLPGDVLLFEVPVAARARLAGRTVAEIRTSEGFPSDCLFIALVDGEGHAELPTGATVLAPGRTAILVARRDRVPGVLACLSAVPEASDPKLSPLVAALRRLPFLLPLGDDELAELAAGVSLSRRARGEVVFREGDPGGELFVVLSGEVALDAASGERTVVGPGAFFGEISLLTGEPRSRTATAHTDCELGVVTQADFSEVVTAHPAIALEMSRVLSQRLAEAARAPRRRRILGGLL